MHLYTHIHIFDTNVGVGLYFTCSLYLRISKYLFENRKRYTQTLAFTHTIKQKNVNHCSGNRFVHNSPAISNGVGIFI